MNFSRLFYGPSMSSLSIFSTTPTTGQAVTMSSREIAELTGKEHRNVMRDIRAMLRDLYDDVGMLGFEHTEINTQNGVAYPIFMLPKRETLILVSGYSTELRARIIDRWQELEAKAAQPQPVALTQAEQDIRIAVLLADALNVAPSGRITMLGVALKHSAPHMLAALPAYAVDSSAKPHPGEWSSSDPTASLTDLLKRHGITMSAAKVNLLLEREGVLEKRTRKSSNGTIKSFWSVTEAGEVFGKNVTSPNNPRETQPHWFCNTFDGLIDLVKGGGK